MTQDNTKIKYFVYCRKSSEDSQRQVASIGDQTDALKQIADREELFLAKAPFTEEKSAKDPGRKDFNEMLDRIQNGEADGLLCWDIDRLSRNPIDNGRLQWMLQKSVIKVIKTPSRSFYPEDAGLLMSIEGGRATDYVVRLSKNVKRGLNSRVAKGWRPSLAPIGYKNQGDKGEKIIVPDEKNFEIVRKMWDLFLTGTYSVTKILDTANTKWGLRTTIRKRLGGKPLSRTQIYEMFKEPFYYGSFEWKNDETGEKELYKGNHQPMITEKEFWRAQVLLGRQGKPQPKTRNFYATGLIKCGECNGTITAEEKHQIICTKCKYKFAYEGRTACAKCKTDISEMINPTILHYTYFHCTKRPCKTCTQRSIKLEDLDTQFNEVFSGLTIDEEYLRVALDYLSEKQNDSTSGAKRISDSLQATHDNVQTRIANLHREYTSPQNINHELYTPDEYLEQKRGLLKERGAIETELNEVKTKFDQSIETTERTFNFCRFALKHFVTDDIQKKRNIFSTIGSNLTLKEKNLNIERIHPHFLLENELRSQKVLFASLEPKKRGYTTRQKEAFETSFATMRGMEESNSRQCFWRALLYHLTNPPIHHQYNKKTPFWRFFVLLL